MKRGCYKVNFHVHLIWKSNESKSIPLSLHDYISVKWDNDVIEAAQVFLNDCILMQISKSS